MKNKKLLLLPFLALILAGCTPDPSSSTPPDSSGPDSSDTLPTVPVELTPKRTIAEIRAMTADGDSASETDKAKVFETKGIVTAKFRGAVTSDKKPAWNISIQEGSAALLLYAIDEDTYAADFAKVKVGDELTVEGNLAAYNGLRELDRVKYVSHKAGTAIVPAAVTSLKQADLKGKDSALVKIDGLKVIDKPNLVANIDGDRTNITLGVRLAMPADLATTISTYMHYSITFADAEATMAKLGAVKSTDTVSWTGILGMNSGLFQLTNANADEWTITPGGEPVVASMAFDKATFELNVDQSELRKLVLTPWDAKPTGVTFKSSDDAIATIDVEGNVKGIAAGEATLTATLGELKAETKVTVKAADAEVTKFVITPFKDELANDKNAELLTLESLLKYSKGLPEGTTVTKSAKFYIGTGGGSSSTDSMPAEYTVFKFSNSSTAGEITISLPAGNLVESVALKGRAWNTDVASLSVNGVSKDFSNAAPANKTDIRDFNYELPVATNVIEFVAVKRLIVTEIVLNLKSGGGQVDPPGPEVKEHFGDAIPEGVTPIATILTSEPALGTVFTTRGVVLGQNGGQIMVQDPLSGKGILGFASSATDAQKETLKLGTVINMTGTYAVNNNGKQLAVTAFEVIAEENLSKVPVVTISSAAELAVVKAATDVNLHSRLVKFVGVKVKSVEEGGTNRYKVTFGGEEVQEISVGFMNSANVSGKGRTEIKALVTRLLAEEVPFDVSAVQLAGAASGALVWNFNSPNLDYYVAPDPKPEVKENFGAAIPEGVTPIATLLSSELVVGNVYTTRGVVLGQNGGQVMIQDPLSGKGILGYGGGLTNEQKETLKLGTVIDMSGKYAVNNNGKQLTDATFVVVAEENLSKVEAVEIKSAAELDLIKASTDVNLHSRLVKFVGVKVKSVEEGGTNRYKITFGGEDSQEISVGFMNAADVSAKGRTQIKALVTALLASQSVIDVYAVQLVGGSSSAVTWSFNSPNLDYIVAPAA